MMKMYKQYLNTTLAEYDMRDVYVGYFIMCYENPGIKISEITEMAQFDKAHTTRIIKKLESKGLIEVKVSEEDRRVKQVFVTSKGEDLFKIIKSTTESWNKQITYNLDSDAKKQFQENLQLINSNAMEVLKGIRDSKEK